MRLAGLVAALLAAHAGAALALTMLGPLSAALPPAVAPGTAFPASIAPGWRFAQADFVDPGYRDTDPTAPFPGYDASYTAPPLAIGTLAEVAAVPPRLPSRVEAIASLDPAHGGFDAAALGVFDIASAQSFRNQSVTLGGVGSGQRLTFKFAGQVGADDGD